MFLIALRDLQFRLRRFLISVVAVALVLSLTLLLAGVAASFDVEIDHTLDSMGVDSWMIASDASGPFIGATALTVDVVDRVRATPGIAEAEALGFYAYTVATSSGARGITLLGVEPGRLGAPRVDHGRALEHPGEVVMQSSFGYRLGDVIPLGGQTYNIVGTLDDSTMFGGIPNVFVSITDLRAIAFKGAGILSGVAVKGAPHEPVPGLKLVSRTTAHDDLVRPLKSAKDTIQLISWLLWVVAGCIIGSVIYLSALERTRDFAVFKAIGVSTRSVLAGLVLQAAVVSLASSIVAIAIGWALAPRLTVPVVLPFGIVALVPITATVVSIVGSFAGVRRAVRVDPALAFG